MEPNKQEWYEKQLQLMRRHKEYLAEREKIQKAHEHSEMQRVLEHILRTVEYYGIPCPMIECKYWRLNSNQVQTIKDKLIAENLKICMGGYWYIKFWSLFLQDYIFISV